MSSRSTERQEGGASSDIASRDIPDQQANDFASILFSRTDPEDLALLDLQARAEIAKSAHVGLSASRPRGEALVTLHDMKIGPGGGDKITVVEAVNDNMPFLLDSTLAEIAELGLSLRLVAHPILSVDRDPSGAFVALRPYQLGGSAKRLGQAVEGARATGLDLKISSGAQLYPVK